jgi:hypothetical protein
MLEVRKALVAFAFFILPATAAAAPPSSETKECIAAFDQGQRSKTEHHLKKAQQELLACTKETCPSVLRADCAEVLRNVQSALPSVVLAADDAGKDVTDVKVTNGAETLATTLDAKAIELDPGTYDFTFEHGDGKPVTVHFVLREGEQNRIVKASFHPKKPEPPPMKTVTPPRSAAGYVVPGALAALGVAGFVFAGVSKLAFASQRDELGNTCAPNCTAAERDDLSGKLVRANIGLGVGIGGIVLAAAAWLVFMPSAKMAAPTTAALTW